MDPSTAMRGRQYIRQYILLPALLALILQDTTINGLCPEQCQCKWKGGKETVECRNSTLHKVPYPDHSTQVLDLSYTDLGQIQENEFRTRKLLNLQKIYLMHCNIQWINGRCFESLTNLVELDLSFNLLTSIPKDALSDCNTLMSLSLKGNQIQRVPQDVFSKLTDLTRLDLSQCQIKELEAGAFSGLDSLQWLQLDNNVLRSIDATHLPPNLRGMSFHNNNWLCDCHLLSFRTFLQNSSVPYEAEPRCSAPDRIGGQQIRDLAENELACQPEVSPTATFQEVIRGKNMSLICSVNAVPPATITWRYRGLHINNGSTMVSDIDLRTYYYRNTGTVEQQRSELWLLGTTLDDNGTFQCIAENRAGVAVANFTLNVVVPVPPRPPQDVVEERFQKEYLIAIGIAGVIVSILAITIVALLAIRCRRSHGRRRPSVEEAKMHLYQKSASGSDFSSEASLKIVQPIHAPSKMNGSVIIADQEEIAHIGAHPFLNGAPNIAKQSEEGTALVGPDIISHTNSDIHRKNILSTRIAIPILEKNVDIPGGHRNASPEAYHEAMETILEVFQSDKGHKERRVAVVSPKQREYIEEKQGESDEKDQLSPPTPFADTRPVSCCFSKDKQSIKSSQAEIQDMGTQLTTTHSQPIVNSKEILLGSGFTQMGNGSKPHQFTTLQRSTGRRDAGVSSNGTSRATRKDKTKNNPDHWHFSTLPRKVFNPKGIDSGVKETNADSHGKTLALFVAGESVGTVVSESSETSRYTRSKSIGEELSLRLVEPVLPPPPQYKSVHFAPGVENNEGEGPPIPTEGLPTGPAKEGRSIVNPLQDAPKVPTRGTSSLDHYKSDSRSSRSIQPDGGGVAVNLTEFQRTDSMGGRDEDFIIPEPETVPITLRGRSRVMFLKPSPNTKYRTQSFEVESVNSGESENLMVQTKKDSSCQSPVIQKEEPKTSKSSDSPGA